MSRLRLFYALLSSQETLDHLSRVQGVLRSSGVRGRFIPRENLHLTLHFLGETDPSDVPALSRLLDSAGGVFGNPPLEFPGTGSFRRGSRDLIYARISDPEGELNALAGRLKEGGAGGDRRPLKPHVTLVRDGLVPEARRREVLGGRFKVPAQSGRSLALMESRFTREGVAYHPLHEFPLK